MQIEQIVNAAPGLTVQLDGALDPEADVLLNGLPLAEADQSFDLVEAGYFEITVLLADVLYRVVTVEPTLIRASIRGVEQDGAAKAGRRMMRAMPASYAQGQAHSEMADTRLTVQVDRAAVLAVEAELPSGLFAKVAELQATRAGFWRTSRFQVSRGINRFRLSASLIPSPLAIGAVAPPGGSVAVGEAYVVGA